MKISTEISVQFLQLVAVCHWSSASPFFPRAILQLGDHLDHRRIMLCVFILYYSIHFYLFNSFYYGYTDIYTVQIINMPPIQNSTVLSPN